ncbi:MAG: hypothetical protein RhofKO_01490 [Rhodothermales bacterium]
MKTFFRILLVLLLLIGLGALGGQVYLGTDAFQDMVERQANALVDGDVTIRSAKGDAFSAFPTLEVELIGVEIERDGETVVDAPEIDLAVDLGPLLRKILVVEVALIDPTLNVTANADGTSSMTRLLLTDDTSEESAFNEVVLEDLRMSGGTMNYENARGMEVGIRGMTADLQAMVNESSLQFGGALSTTAVSMSRGLMQREEDLPAALTMALSLGNSLESAELTEAELQVGRLTVDLIGMPIDWNSVPRLVELALRLRDAIGGIGRDDIEAIMNGARDEAGRLLNNEADFLQQNIEQSVEEALRRSQEAIEESVNRLNGILGGQQDADAKSGSGGASASASSSGSGSGSDS